MQIFCDDKDYEAFRRVVEEALRVAPVRICVYCWLPNHWHFVLWPERDGDLSKFMQRMANMHTQRWQRAKLRVGYGHLYQARFKSFPIESDEHFYCVARYVERNAVRARLVRRGGLEVGKPATADAQGARSAAGRVAAAGAVRLDRIRHPAADKPKLAAIRRSICRGSPYGSHAWTEQVAERLGLQSTLRAAWSPSQKLSIDTPHNAYCLIYAPVPFIPLYPLYSARNRRCSARPDQRRGDPGRGNTKGAWWLIWATNPSTRLGSPRLSEAG